MLRFNDIRPPLFLCQKDGGDRKTMGGGYPACWPDKSDRSNLSDLLSDKLTGWAHNEPECKLRPQYCAVVFR